MRGRGRFHPNPEIRGKGGLQWSKNKGGSPGSATVQSSQRSKSLVYLLRKNLLVSLCLQKTPGFIISRF